MTLTKSRVEEIKVACLTAVHKAMRGFTAQDVTGLHQRAVKAAESVRADNELAYVKVSVDNVDDSAFVLIVDLTSGENDAFRINYGVKPKGEAFTAIFAGSSDVTDKR